ncbi:uncharacterized protein [Venturia canescens]|uniref:uncharacterized protein n=1 Tax=Venturia canescens TaxID=32260 RepID=UPI001C9C68CD|nr:uncharacterized protein LOC122418406 [Venturia canescens]
MNVEIREARKEDCKAIHELIQELAVFEKMPNGPKTDYKDLERDGFETDPPLFKAFVVVHNAKIIGHALYYYTYCSWEGKSMFLDEFYISPNYRNKGIGDKVFKTIAKKAIEDECKRLEFSVLGWNPAKEFYLRREAVDITESEGWHHFRISSDALKKISGKSVGKYHKMNVEIREARKEDCKAIYELIQELAVFEKMPNGPKTDHKDLERDGFETDPPLFKAFVVVDNAKIIGHALYYYTYSSWEGKSMFLDDFYISPNYRNEGIGDKVFEAVAKLQTRNSSLFPLFSNKQFLIFWQKSCGSSDFYGKRAFDVDEEKRQKIIQNRWGGYGLHFRLWDEKYAPVTKIREREELVLDNSEYCGILSDRMIGACSSFLTLNPENGRYVLSKCDLNNLKLKDVSILRYHRYIQYLDLSHNILTDLRSLSGVPYLVYLNASHNRIKDLLNFASPWFLTYVNLSHNEITLMKDLTQFWSIVRLDLSHNAIETITGLKNLRYLKYLNLSYNLIETVSNLDDLLSIQELNLEYNYITSFKSADPDSGINTLANLRTLIMGHNRLSTLEFFRDAYGLRLIDLRYNKIADLLEVSNLKSRVYEVDLRGNPCTQWPNYKDVLLFSMPSVKYLDGSEITVSEKVSSATLFDPPIELLAARSISKLLLLEQLSIPKIDASITPYDLTSPPLVILSGPSAVKKVTLGIRVAKKLGQWVRYCRSHTTREVTEEEDESEAYYFVSREEFNGMLRRGEFLSIQELLGNSYGFHWSEIAAMRRENKVGITQMDLNATMQMMHNYENVKAILVMTKCEQIHREWISEKFHIFTWIKDSVENLLALKIGRNIVTESPETSSSRIGFISGIIDDVLETLELPEYSMFVRPQSTGETNTDLIEHSKTYLPKTIITQSQLEMEEKKKHITFKSESDVKTKSAELVVEESLPKASDLRVIFIFRVRPKNFRSFSISVTKFDQFLLLGFLCLKKIFLIKICVKFKLGQVILDEYSNIIVDDKESKLKRKKARALYMRSVQKLRSEGIHEIEDEDEPDESLSSGQSVQLFSTRRAIDPENLKNTYIEMTLKSRNIYVKKHQKMPGFFCHVIFTDVFDVAEKRLIEIIHGIHSNELLQKPTPIPEIEYLEKHVVPKKVQTIVKELRESLSTSKIQRKTLLRTHGLTSWKEAMPSQMSQDPKELVQSSIE